MDVVRNMLDRATGDPASKAKFGLSFLLGFVAFIITCVELHKSGESGVFVRKWNDKEESSMLTGKGLPMLAATVCPLPLNCPDWCVNDKKSDLFCKCVDDPSTLEYTLNTSSTQDNICNFVEGPATNPHDPPVKHAVNTTDSGDVPFTTWDGFQTTIKTCINVNYEMTEMLTSADQFIMCDFHSSLAPGSGPSDPGREPYPDALLDAKVAVTFHKSPDGPWPVDKYHTSEVDPKTGILLSPHAWELSAGYHFTMYELEIMNYRGKSFDMWFHKTHTKFTHFMHDSRSMSSNTSTWDNPRFFAFVYQYGQDATFDEWKEETPYTSREALGVAGGIGFFLFGLNIVLFTVLASVMSWDTSGNNGGGNSYSYDGAKVQPPPSAPVDGGNAGGGYGSIA